MFWIFIVVAKHRTKKGTRRKKNDRPMINPKQQL